MAYKLLLADDSQTIQKVVELVLNREGFDILACSDGEEAMKVFLSGMPDIVLADIEMPKLNGYQLCEKIKKDPATANIPVILLAGAFEPFDEDYSRSVGADDFIMKPFESHELVSKVKSLIAGPVAKVIPAATTVRVVEEPAASELAGVSAAQETEWFESIPQDEMLKQEEQAVTVSVSAVSAEEMKAFDDELRESMQKLEEEAGLETATNEKALPGEVSGEEVSPEEISIEEISKMVKEAIGEPVVPEIESGQYGGAAPAYIHKPEPSVFAGPTPEPVQQPAAISKAEINAAVLDSIGAILPSVVRESVERAVSDTVPNLLEEALRESLREMSDYIHNAVNAEIRKVVPGLADAIIKREIEKITSELT